MNFRAILLAFAVAGSALSVSAGGAAALSANDLVGTWTLVTAKPFGPNPKGILMFDANGRMTATVMRTKLPNYASKNRNRGTPAEYKAIAQGSLAYYGSYSVSGTDLLIHVEGSTYPNWAGTTQKRTNVTVAGDELKWTVAAPSGGGAPPVTVWRRAK